MNEPRPAIAHMPAAQLARDEASLPTEDERISRLKEEVRVLLNELKATREIADVRHVRCSELLEEARKAKRLTRAFLEELDDGDIDPSRLKFETLEALRTWAAEVL